MRSASIVFKDVTTTGIDSGNTCVQNSLDILKLPFQIIRDLPIVNKLRPKKDIIRNVTGVIQPGEMCLVLRRPGAGCSTLLKTMTGEPGGFLSFKGDINYDGVSQHEMMKRYKSDVIYNGELDVHYSQLTVDQTLRFTLVCKTRGTLLFTIPLEKTM